MLAVTGHASLDELTAAALPPGLADPRPLDLPPAASEAEALAELRRLAGAEHRRPVHDRPGLLRHASPRR